MGGPNDLTRVRFSVRYESHFGERVVLVGSVAELGGWDPFRGRELTVQRATPGVWQTVVKLPTDSTVYYKYITLRLSTEDELRGNTTDAVTWEHTDGDRSLHVRGHQMKVNDDEFGKYDKLTAHARVQVITMPAPIASRGAKAGVGGGGGALASAEARDDPRLAATRKGGGSDSPFPEEGSQNDALIVIYRLPVKARRKGPDGAWSLSWDADALYLTSEGVRRALGEKVKWVGILNTEDEVKESEREAISKELWKRFNCVPVYIPHATLTDFYQGFCKGLLWPAFHMNSSVTDESRRMARFDYRLWGVYKEVNSLFAKEVVAAYQAGDLIWVHDYHLMTLPAELRAKIPGAKIGFFLHIPWPSSETYRELPVRDEILRGVLSSNLLGFHLFDYARHFLSACRRVLKLDYEARRGLLGVEFMGRHVNIRVSHIGIDPTRINRELEADGFEQRVAQLENRFKGKFVMGGIDDLDHLKGISLKLLSFEKILHTYVAYRGQLVLVQIAIPKRARMKDSAVREIRMLQNRINDTYGTKDYQPLVYIEEDISFAERIAYYRLFDVLLLTPIRDGLNLVPYEYIASTSQQKGQLILSEFTGCSRALSGAVRVNPWNWDEIFRAIDTARTESLKHPKFVIEKHAADMKYVTAHSTANWAESFLSDLQGSSVPAVNIIKLGSSAPVMGKVQFQGFAKLNGTTLARSYCQSTHRLFLLDYDGTLTSSKMSSQMSHAWATPTDDVLSALKQLAAIPKNIVFIMSGRTREVLDQVFDPETNIGLAAEHGFSFRFPGEEWESPRTNVDLSWKKVAKEIMHMYSERTDGAYIEEKRTGLVWHFGDADPEFGNWQSKELSDHLRGVLASFDVEVVNGKDWLQVRLVNVNKAEMAKRILDRLRPERSPDFIFCAGDDRTDEDMFNFLAEMPSDHVFTCTVGMKPSNARYYVREAEEVGRSIIELSTADTTS